MLLGLLALGVVAAPAHATPIGTYSFQGIAGANRSHQDGSSIYFNPTGAGSFRLTVAASEPSGIQQVAFDTAGAGWTGGAVDSTDPFEMTYTWGIGAAASPNRIAMIRANNSTQASLTYSFVADSTPPTGSFLLASDARTSGCDCGVELDLDPGTDAGSGIRAWYVKRSEAVIDEAGDCGAFNTPNYDIAQPTSGYIDTAATSGHCYRYAIYVLDNVNNTIETADHQIELPEPVPPAVSFDGFTPLTGLAWMHADQDTLYFNPAQSGSFRIDGSAAHPSGIASMTFAAPGVSGWTPGAPIVDGSDPYEATWAWNTGAAAPGTRTLTARATSDEEGQATFEVVADAAAPTGGSIAYADGQSNGTVQVTFADGADSGSGIDDTALLSRTAPLIGATCGDFGSWAQVGADDPVSPVTAPQLAVGACYEFALRVTDHVGNTTVVTASSVVRVPHAPADLPSTDQPTGTAPEPTVQSPVPSVTPVPPVQTSERFVVGSSKSDLVVRGSMPDTVVAGGGNDRVSGGAGNDIVGAGSGSDKITGGSGNDQITAGTGNDVAAGGAGRDFIVGGGGKDTLKGGPGDDVLLSHDQQGGDVIQCGSGIDTVSADRGDFIARDCERFTETSPAQQPTGATTPPKNTGKPTKVSICHATGSASNPYVWLTVPIDGMNGHNRHADDIIPAPEMGCPKSTKLPPAAEPAGSVPPPPPPPVVAPPVVTPPVKPVEPTPPPVVTPPVTQPVVTPPPVVAPPKPTPPVDACTDQSPVTMSTPRPNSVILAACKGTAFVEIFSDPFVRVALPQSNGRFVSQTLAVGYGLASFKLASGATVSWSTAPYIHTIQQVTIAKGAHVTTMYAMGAARWGYASSYSAVHTELTRRDLSELQQRALRCTGSVSLPLTCR